MAVFVLVCGSSFNSRTTTNGKCLLFFSQGCLQSESGENAFGINFCVVLMVFAIVQQTCSLALFCMGAVVILVLKQHST
jgi:hypothetical protein